MVIKSQLKRKPIIFLTLIGMAILAGLGVFLAFGATVKESEPPGQIIRPVKVIMVEESATKERRSFPGLVNAARETKLAFRVSGPLVALDVRIGRHVQKGTTIARIDPRDFEINVMRLTAALNEARANLKAMKSGARKEDIARLEAELIAARSRLNDARKDFQRHEDLLAGRAVSQIRYDTAKTALATARANVEVLNQQLKKARTGARIEKIEAAEARIARLATDLKAAQNALDDTLLKAPFDGYVSRRYVENFENVRAGEPIVSFLDVSNVEVDTAVPEDLIIRRSFIHDIHCTLDAYPQQRFTATVKEIGRKTDSANQSYPLTVTLDIPEGLVVEPGMAATLQVSLSSTAKLQNGFLLPAGAVFANPDGRSCVWRLDLAQMKVVKTPVTTGRLNKDTIHILTGLESGDRVVTAGARFLQEGQPVRILQRRGEGRS
jgi:multidrug efflux pump subunit AcrA (membrane-fusion protein)